MPYRDLDKRRAYKKHWARMRKAGEPGSIAGSLPGSFRLRTAQDVLSLISRHVEAVESAAEAGTLEKARTVGSLAGIALKAVEVTDLGARLAKVEGALAKKGQPVTPLPAVNGNGAAEAQWAATGEGFRLGTICVGGGREGPHCAVCRVLGKTPPPPGFLG